MADHVDRQHVAHAAFHRQHRAVRDGAQEVGEVVDVGRIHAAADRHPVHHQRPLVDAAADQALHRLVAVDVVELESALDAGGAQALDVFLDQAGAGGNDHLAIGLVVLRLGHGRAGDVRELHLLDHVHLGRIDRDRHLIRLGVEFGQHVAGVVLQPLGGGAVGLGREGDRAADLDDHVRHRLAHAGDQFIEHGQALGALAVQLAHMQVQHGGAGVVAVDRLLHLLIHGDGNVFRKIRRDPLGTIGRCGDDQLVLVFGKQ